MSDIIRRGKAVPVQARRAETQPDTIQIPGAGPIHVPPQQPGVTQNIIYVNVPAGQPQQAPPPSTPAEPSEIHVHNHIHQYPNRRRGGRYGTSFLGTLGFVLGLVACGACYVPQLVWLARFIAVAGVGCAGLGLLGSVLFRKNAAFMPLFALIVTAFAYWLWMMKSGHAKLDVPKEYQQYVPQPDAVVPSSPTSPTVTPVTPATPAPRLLAPAPPTATTPPDRTRLHDSSIFGDGGHWGNGTNPPQPATPSTPAPSVATPPAAPVIDSTTAAQNLETARMIAARKMGVDYTTAKTAADDAEKERDEARQTAEPGSPELKSAWQAYFSATSKLTAVQKQLDADPAVAAAEATLKAAKAAGK